MTSSKPKGGLGKGLGALFGNAGVAPQNTENARDKVQEIEVAKIRPNRYQPREEFDEAALSELTESVHRYGVLQPVL